MKKSGKQEAFKPEKEYCKVEFEKFNSQFIRQVLFDKTFTEQIYQVCYPGEQFEKEQPNFSAFCFIANKVVHTIEPLEKLKELLQYLAEKYVPEFHDIKEYRAIMNACKLLKIITI